MLEIIESKGLLFVFPKIIQATFLAFLVLKVIDFITGMLKVAKNGGYKSSKMRDGFIRFVAELVSLMFVIVLDLLLGLNFYLSGIVLLYLVYKESGSITENLGEIGVYLPPQISEKIEVLNPKNNNEGGNKNE